MSTHPPSKTAQGDRTSVIVSTDNLIKIGDYRWECETLFKKT